MLRQLSRWHVWLGWLIGVPLLFWTASGLFMASWPIEDVRGGALRAEPIPVSTKELVLPQGIAASRLALVSESARPVWIATLPGGALRRFDARTGAALPEVDETEARTIALAGWRGTAALEGLSRFDAAHSPIDLRRERPSWQARFGDGTHLYIDAGTGEVLAVRTRLWRAYDFMWGLHIMDLQGRENAHHPLLISIAGLALAGTLMGCVLLFRRRGRREPPSPNPRP